MLFASFRYHISPSLSSTRIEELKHVLDSNGACEAASSEAWWKEANLVVSNSLKFEGWEQVEERNALKKEEEEVYIVTDKWVDRSLVLGKTQSPYHYSPNPALIFSGVIACAASLPPSDLEVLSAGITALGGQWRTGLTKDVTHLFAMSPDSQKYATAMHFREETGVKIVLPHWFDDVVRLGMGGLSTDVYEWPDPELLRNPLGVGGGSGGHELTGAKKNMYAMAALFTTPMHESSSPPLKDLEIATAAATGIQMEVDIWKGKKIVLSRTLQLFERRREAVEIGIKRAGGVVVRYDGDEEVDEASLVVGGTGEGAELSKREQERRKNEAEKVLESDILVTRWRDGRGYVVALRSHKTIGTLAWLFHVQSTGTITRPLDQLLHYPVPKRPIEAFSNHVITVTNYTGEAREYIKKLIIAMGAKFTPSMSGQNTVLIAAYISGTKATKAQSWSIPIVNHTWLEDCFIQWRNLTVGLEKYIAFPTGVDFSQLLGVRGVGEVVEAEILDDEIDGAEAGDGPRGTDTSAGEVQRLVDVPVHEEGEVTVDLDVEHQKTPTKKKTYNTSPTPKPTSLRPSSPKTPQKHAGPEDERNGKQKGKAKNGVSSPEDDEVNISSHEQKTMARKNKLASLEDEIDENEDEMEAEKKVQVQPRSAKSRVQDDDDEAMEEEEGNEEEVIQKSKGVVKVGKKRKLVDEDNEQDDLEYLKAKPKAVPTPTKYPTKPSSKPTTTTHSKVKSTKKQSKVAADLEDDKSGSQDELSSFAISPPPRVRSTKLIRRVSGVAIPDVGLDADEPGDEEEKEEEEKAKPRLSLLEKSQAKKGDARTRIRKRKVAEVEEDEEEEEELVVVAKSKKGKAKPKSVSVKAKGKGKSRGRVEHSDSAEDDDDGEDDDKPRKQPSTKSTKSSKSKRKSISDDDDTEEEREEVQSPSDSDSDLPAAPFLPFVNGKKVKRVSDGSGSASKSISNKPVSAKSKKVVVKSTARSKPVVETESEDDAKVGARDVLLATPKRTMSVLMPSLNLSGNKKKGVKKVEKGRKGKKTKLSVSSTEEEDDEDENEEEPDVRVSPSTRAITRTDSIRVMSNHKVQVSTKYPGTPTSSKKNANAVASSSKSNKSKLKTTPMDVDSPMSSLPSSPVTKTTTISPKTKLHSPTRKRSAATKATQKLHDSIMPDLVHFESQMRRANTKGRKSGGMSAFKIEGDDEGGRRRERSQVDNEGGAERAKKRQRVNDDDDDDNVAVSVTVSAKGKGKRKVREEEVKEEEGEVETRKKSKSSTKRKTVVIVASDNENEEDDEDDDGVVVSSSKAAKTKSKKEKDAETSSKPGVVLLTTQVTLSDDVIRTLTKLGVRMTSRPSECTHLLAPQLVRTEKFLCALVVAPFILTEKWATRSAAVKKLLPEKDFALHDTTGENKYGVDLVQSLRRAKELRGKLLAGQTFYVTPKVPVDTKLLKNVVNACGGHVTTQHPTVRIITASPNRHVISCKEDIAVWRPMAAQGIPIYSQELLLTGALKQKMEWDADDIRVDL